MGRKKPNRPDLRLVPTEHVKVPMRDQVVVKEVPATVHWDNLPGSGRTDIEIVGRCLIYEDGSQDLIIFEDISEGAKEIVKFMSGATDNYSISED